MSQNLSSHVPQMIISHTQNNGLRVAFSGDWQLKGAPPPNIDEQMHLLHSLQKVSVELTTHSLVAWDSALLATVLRILEVCRAQENNCSYDGLPEGARNLLNLALAVQPNTEAQRQRVRESFLSVLGGYALVIPQRLQAILEFTGELTLSLGRLFKGRAACSMQDVWKQMQDCGAEALPITTLISLLVGLILAFVGALQLSMFGAEIYVSSLVAIGMTRIMGAVMTGIILAGRTGASYAATLGTMQVNEEIDALVTQGIAPSDFLVLPRMIALSLMTPLLVLYADFAGLLGGFAVGVLALGLEPVEYITFSKIGFKMNNLWVGVTHGFVYGIIIAFIGCYQGLRCGRSAAAVGMATTSAVVFSIVGIVLATALLTLLFNVLQI